jgi:uncharacterized membrane-anchored protein
MTRRIAVLIGFFLQLLAVFALFIPSQILLSTGTKATLLTIPVDPRSIFRGEYVTLDYEAAQKLPLNWEYGTPVYTILEKKGDVYVRKEFSKTKPVLSEDQICIRGVPEYNRVYFRDIAQYFVPQGQGMDIQNAIRSHRVLVDITTDSACRAIIRGIRLGPEAPLEDSTFEDTIPAPVESAPVKTK